MTQSGICSTGSYLPSSYSFSPYGSKASGSEDSEKSRASPSIGCKSSSESKALDILQQHASHYKSKSPTVSGVQEWMGNRCSVLFMIPSYPVVQSILPSKLWALPVKSSGLPLGISGWMMQRWEVCVVMASISLLPGCRGATQELGCPTLPHFDNWLTCSPCRLTSELQHVSFCGYFTDRREGFSGAEWLWGGRKQCELQQCRCS